MTLPVLQAFAGALFLFMAFVVVLGLVTVALSIYMVYWTYQDAQKRGMDNPEIWGLVVVMGNVMGFVTYLLVRDNHYSSD